MLKAALVGVSALLPWRARRRLLQGVFGWELHATARIGWAAVYARRVVMGAGSRIGHFTVIKGLEKLEVGAGSGIGWGNWISGYPLGGAAFGHVPDRRPELVVEEQAFITHRHRIDCTDAVRVGAFTTVAGYDTQILTHTIDVLNNRQTCAPVTIGRYCFVGTRVVFLSGSELPDRSVLGAGAVVHGALREPGMFYAGTPARGVKSMPEGAAYFRRTQGYVA